MTTNFDLTNDLFLAAHGCLPTDHPAWEKQIELEDECQSARNIDPLSASNIDPLMMIVGAGRTPELVRVAQAFGPRGAMVMLCS